MRAAFALFVVGLAVGAAVADPAKRTATVEIDGVEVRAGHGFAFPATGQLRKGESVLILREEESGFFAIQPPTGSVSWIKQIHLGKVEPGEGGKANVPVAIEAAEVLAGVDKDNKPTNRVTARLPRGTIVEVLGAAVRIDNAHWFPITPPEGDLRWVPKGALKASSMTALAPPPPYHRPDTPGVPVSGDRRGVVGTPAVATLPAGLTEHRLWAEASQLERTGDYGAARARYARIYQDLWDQKAEREAIVYVYNQYTRCDELFKKGEGVSRRPETDGRPGNRSESRDARGEGKWSSPGVLNELPRVFVDGQQVYSLQDDRGAVAYYVTSVQGINLKTYAGKRVQLYGTVAQRPELYRPHLLAERVEVAK
jgi:hypothetical protein